MRLLAVAMTIGAAAAPRVATAQGFTYATLTVSAMQTYDDNLFASMRRDRQQDLFARVGPTLEVGYESRPLAMMARYGFEAERYVDHASLNRALARQAGAIELRRSARRLALDLKGSYVSTNSLGDLNVESTLIADRARAERTTAASTASYAWTPVTRLEMGYLFSRDVLQAGPSAVVHEAHIAIDQPRASTRHTQRIEYRLRGFRFGDRGSETWHVLTGRWSRDLTRRLAVEVVAGPRVADGQVRPELGAIVRRKFQKGELSAGYANTQATVFGETGAIDVQRVAGTAVYRAARRVTLSAAPAFAASSRGGARVSVYAVDVEATGRLRRGVFLLVAGRIGVQQGTFSSRSGRIPFRRLSVGVVTTLPWSRDERGEPPTS